MARIFADFHDVNFYDTISFFHQVSWYLVFNSCFFSRSDICSRAPAGPVRWIDEWQSQFLSHRSQLKGRKIGRSIGSVADPVAIPYSCLSDRAKLYTFRAKFSVKKTNCSQLSKGFDSRASHCRCCAVDDTEIFRLQGPRPPPRNSGANA